MKARTCSLNQQHSLRREVAEGLLYAHSRLNANTSKTLEAASFLYALVELLSKKGLLTIEELDECKLVMGQGLGRSFDNLTNRTAFFQRGNISQEGEYNA